MNASFSTRPGASRRSVLRNLALVAVVGVCSTAGSTAVAAVTTGRVFGKAPAGASVLISSPDYGIHRRSQVNAGGHYQVTWLPIGVYTVTVIDDGQPLIEHPSVPVSVDRGSRVDFNCVQGRCSEMAGR